MSNYQKNTKTLKKINKKLTKKLTTKQSPKKFIKIRNVWRNFRAFLFSKKLFRAFHAINDHHSYSFAQSN